jgi:tetratricopeptide (TPR) repeat protein
MHIERALSIYPTYAHALALRGILQLMAGDRDSGSKDLELAVQYDPALVRAYVALANVYNDRHEFDRSSKMAEKAKLLAPRFWQGYYEAARANLGRGNFDDALSNAQEAERLASGDFKSAASLARASALIGKGDNEKAAVLLRVLLARPLPPAQEELAKNFLANLSH